jgi:gag-polypeptide of LTR copia-type/Domain of unknown function (DUF4219)
MSSYLSVSYHVAPLDGTNYSTWKVKMEMLLIRESLWSIVSERRTAPSPAGNTRGRDELIKWEEDSERAAATIFLYLGDRAQKHVQDMRNPVAVWKKLKETYEMKGFSARFYLWKKLFNLKLADHKSEAKATKLEVYIDQCQSVFQQLKSSGANVSSKLEASALLNGLDNTYETFAITTIQSFRQNDNGNASEVSVDHLIHQLLDEDRRRNFTSGTAESEISIDTSAHAMVARHGTKRPRIECQYCDRSGHSAKDCWDANPDKRPPKRVRAHASIARLDRNSDIEYVDAL